MYPYYIGNNIINFYTNDNITSIQYMQYFWLRNIDMDLKI